MARNQSIDVSRFEEMLFDFKDNAGNNYRLAQQYFEDATNRIDNIISSLEKLKESFRFSERQLGFLNGKVEDLTIRKLTKDNPTLRIKRLQGYNIFFRSFVQANELILLLK